MLSRLQKYETVLRKVNKEISWVSFLAIVFITLMVVLDVFLRFVFNSPLPATVEMSELIMPIAVFPPMAYALSTNTHVCVTLLTNRFPQKAQKGCSIFANLLSFAVCLLITYYGWGQFWHSVITKEEMLAAISLPWWIGKFFLPFGFAFFSLTFLFNLLLDFIPKASTKEVVS